MDDNNKIHYSDLVSPDVQQGFESWIDQIKQLQAQREVSIGEIKKKMEELRKQMTAPSGGGNIPKPNTKEVTDEIDKLREVYKNLKVDVQLYDDAIQALNKSEKKDGNGENLLYREKNICCFGIILLSSQPNINI